MDNSAWPTEELKRLRSSAHWSTKKSFDPDECTKLAEKLRTDLRMIDVWHTLKKRQKKQRFAWEYDFGCEVVRLSRGPRGLEAMSKQEALEKVGHIIAASHVIRRELDCLSLDIPVHALFGDDEDHDRGTNVADKMAEALRVIGVFPGPRARRQHAASARELRTYPTCRDAWQGVEYDYLEMGSKDITDLLAELEKVLKQVIGVAPTLDRPHHRNARLHYFVRGLTLYMMEQFGHPLRQVVADTATVVFDPPKELTKDAVARIAPTPPKNQTV